MKLCYESSLVGMYTVPRNNTLSNIGEQSCQYANLTNFASQNKFVEAVLCKSSRHLVHMQQVLYKAITLWSTYMFLYL